MARSKTFYVAPIEAPAPTSYGLFDLDGAWVAATIGAVETRKRRSFFRSDEDYSRGYQALSEMEWRLVMDATQTIVSEIRSTRGAIPANTEYSLDVYEAGMYPGIQLADLVDQQNHLGLTTAQILTEIRDLLAAGGQASEEQLELLGRLVILMGA